MKAKLMTALTSILVLAALNRIPKVKALIAGV